VPADSTYSGTLYIGKRNADASFTTYCAMTLTDASAVQITAVALNASYTGFVPFFMIANLDQLVDTVMPSGTFELKEGQVMLGSPTKTSPSFNAGYTWLDFWTDIDNNVKSASNLGGVIVSLYGYLTDYEKFAPFNGTVSAADFSVTSNYTLGTVVSVAADGKALLSSLIYAISTDDAMLEHIVGGVTVAEFPENDERTLSFSGTASIQFPEAFQKTIDMNMGNIGGLLDPVNWFTVYATFTTVDVNVTIEDGAIITVGDRDPSVAEDVYIRVSSSFSTAYLISEDGLLYPCTGSWFDGVSDCFGFSYVPLGDYSLFVVISNMMYYSGAVSVVGSGMDYAITVPTNSLTNNHVMDSEAIWIDNTENALAFDVDHYEYVCATDGNSVGKADAETGIVTFADDKFDGDWFVVVLKAYTAGQPFVYYLGNVKDDPTANSNDADSTVVGVVGSVAKLSDPGKIFVPADAVTPALAIAQYRAADDVFESTIMVKGQLDFLYASDEVCGIMDIWSFSASGDGSFLRFDGDGIISHGVSPSISPIAPDGIVGGGDGYVRAAYYYINEGASPVKSSTYYFTTLATAIKNSKEITLLGRNVIYEDTILDNPDFDKINIYIGSGASLEIGTLPTETEYPADANAVLTIPEKTKVIRQPGSVVYEVVNGQAVYDLKPTKANEPDADVLVTGGGKFIYTDVSTGLNVVSKSGDVLSLLRPATMLKNATLKAGVELKDDKTVNGYLIVPKKITLTVDGTLTVDYWLDLDNGTVIVNGVFNTKGANIDYDLTGEVVVASGGVFNNENTEFYADTIVIDGIINMKGPDAYVCVDYLYLTGTVNFANTVVDDDALHAHEYIQIGAEPELSSGYTNTAAINGWILLRAGTGFAKVYGNFDITGDTKDKLIFDNDYNATEYFIGDVLYLTVYTDDANDVELPMFYEDQLKDVIIHDWNNERLLRGTFLSKSVFAPYIGELKSWANTNENWTEVYADFEYKKYDVTFSYHQGMTWVNNGVNIDGGKVIQVEYGKTVTVTTAVQPGYQGTPVLKANGASYTAGTAYKVTANVVFTASGVEEATAPTPGLTLIEILLIIIVIIIAVIALIVAVKLLRS
jgi:hypothetical protein